MCCVVVIVFAGMLFEAHGCTCMAPRTADIDFKQAAFVAIFKVEGSGRIYKPEKKQVYYKPGQSLLSVKQVYKGDLKIGEKLVFRHVQSSMCGWSFSKEQIGSEFLMYLDSAGDPIRKPVKPAIWSGSICSGSGLRDFKGGDLAYLDNYAMVKGKTRISGTIYRELADSGELLRGHKVTIDGEGKKIELTTDKNGVYEIYDLPPGKYTVTSAVVDGYAVRNGKGFVEIDLKKDGHVEQEFTFVQAK
jgi:hypothetical protein